MKFPTHKKVQETPTPNNLIYEMAGIFLLADRISGYNNQRSLQIVFHVSRLLFSFLISK